MEKTIICEFWEKRNCKFMEKPSLCCYAHGMKELKKVDCKYGPNCSVPKCLFFHGNTSTINKMVYDIPIINKKMLKRNNKKGIKKISIVETYCKNIDTKSIQLEKFSKTINKVSDIATIDTYNIGSGIVTIIKKEEDIKEQVIVKNPDTNKLLPFVDEYYKNIIIKKNKFINNIVTDNYRYIVNIRNENKKTNLKLEILNEKNNINDNIINKLKKENDLLKSQNNELKTENNKLELDKLEMEKENKILKETNTTSMVDHESSNINKNKLLNLYNKYVNLYNIFKNQNNYKGININEINKYTKDKNIYKIKQRSVKIYNYYNKLVNGVIKEYLPIYKIIRMPLIN